MKVCTICGAKWRGDPSVCPLDGGSLEDLPDALLARTIAGRYVVTERIGAGGMGTVYRARHEIVGRDVAIKFLAPELALDATSRSRFLREAKAANRINHEHIIDITDYGETQDGLVYLVMEFLDGRPLGDAIDEGRFPAFRAVDVARQIAYALARAHELDVIHRDIKPDNVYLLERPGGGDFVKLLDFGLAKMKGEIRLTASGAVFGTPEYMAPEQARGKPLTGKADLYALGCVLYEMLTGSPPFDGPTPDLILSHISAVPPVPSELVPNIPPDLDAIVLRLLAKEPDDRYADAHHLGEELRAVADTLPRPSSLPMSTEKRVADAMSVTLARFDTQPTISSSETWDAKIARFRELAGRAHETTPAWLAVAMDELEGWVRDLALRRAELDRSAGVLIHHEDELRSVRLQIGKAIDVLVRDESRTLREIDGLRSLVDGAEVDTVPWEARLRDAWADLPPLPPPSSPIDSAAVDRLRQVGAAADEWASLEQRRRELAEQMGVREQGQDDLRFQVAQLKGRLGTLNAEGELDLGEMRERTVELDRSVQGLLDKIASRSEEIVKHLLEFPELRDSVRAGAS